MIRPTLIELIYYSLIVSLNKCNGSCNGNFDLYTKMRVLSKKKKDVNVKVFKIITRINEAKMLVRHISVNHKCELDSTKCN